MLIHSVGINVALFAVADAVSSMSSRSCSRSSSSCSSYSNSSCSSYSSRYGSS